MREPVTIDLGAPAQIADLPGLATRFFRWWLGELRALVPWRQTPVAARRHAVLHVRTDRWFLRPSPDAEAVALDTKLSDGDLADRLLNAASGAPLSKLTVLLPRDFAITRRLELPQMSLAHARQAVDLQIDRLSPFKADAVRTATRIAGYDTGKSVMLVDVAIVPLQRVQPIEQRLRALGFTSAAVDIEGDNGEPQGFDLSEPQNAADLRQTRQRALGLAAAAAAIWIVAIYAWGQAGESEIKSWEARVAELRPAAARSAALRQSVDGMGAPIARANAHDPAVTLNVLQQLTRLLPDSVQLLDLKLEGNVLQLSGLAANAPDLIGLLEGSPAFKNVKFVSPVVRKAETGVERFEIALQLETGAL
ncbi:MAG: PilN domain-containing protein [Micropepsaceae bacterium]